MGALILLVLACAPRRIAYPCWPDTDFDGLGDGTAQTGSCTLTGYVPNDDDCDDTDPAIGLECPAE